MRADFKNITCISFLPNDYDNPFNNEEIDELHKLLRNPILSSIDEHELDKNYGELFKKHLKNLLGKEVNKNTLFIIPFEWNYYSRSFFRRILLEIGMETTYTIITDVVLIGYMLHSVEEIKDGIITYIYGKKGVKGLFVQFLKEGDILQVLAVYRRNNPLKIHYQKNLETQLFIWGNSITSQLEAQNKSYHLIDIFSIERASSFLEKSNIILRYKTTPYLCFRQDILDKKILLKSSYPQYFPFSFQVKDMPSDNFYLELYGAFCESMDLLELARLEIRSGSSLGRIESNDEFIINVIIEIVDGCSSTISIRYIDFKGITHEKKNFFEVPNIVV